MKTFSVQEFLKISKCTLRLFGPIVYSSDKVCCITLQKANDIKNVVWTDHQVFDATALHSWLNCCNESKKDFCVIPGMHITCIHGLIWHESVIRYVFNSYFKVKQRVCIFFNPTTKVREQEKRKKKINIVIVSETINKMILQSKTIKRSRIKFSGKESAFKVVQRI